MSPDFFLFIVKSGIESAYHKATNAAKSLRNHTIDTAIRQGIKTAPDILYLSVFSVVYYCFYDISNTFTIVISVVPNKSYTLVVCG